MNTLEVVTASQASRYFAAEEGGGGRGIETGPGAFGTSKVPKP